MNIFTYAGLKAHIEGFFSVPTDVVNQACLKPGLRHQSALDAVYAF